MIKALMVFIMGSFIFLYWSHSNKTDPNRFTECVGRGTVYYQEIGSYPKLSDGRDAHSVAAEHCYQSITAY